MSILLGEVKLSPQTRTDSYTFSMPPTLVVTAMAAVPDVKKTLTPVCREGEDYLLLGIDLTDFQHGMGGSCYAKVLGEIGARSPDVISMPQFKSYFNHR